MKPGVRVLYLLRAEETHAPTHLLRAAESLHMLRAGRPADAPAREHKPQVICIHAPFDHEAQHALEAVSDLRLPVLGIGSGSMDGLTSQVSEVIPTEDLRSVLGLMASITEARESGGGCQAENAGHCQGSMVEDLVRLLEHMLCLRFADHKESSERVCDAALWIGNHLTLPPAELKDLLRASRLRDIGKLGLTHAIVFARRSERTPEEQAAYDRYPEMGARVLSELPSFRSVAEIVKYQLENFDGSGPAGLMAHQIPLGSRVLRVAAAFAGITLSGDNPQRAARDAITTLEQGRGSLFDPLLVKLVANFHQARKDVKPETATRWVRVTDLSEGMVIAEDVWSRTGMKILPSGTHITPHILRLIRQFPLDPSLESVQILK